MPDEISKEHLEIVDKAVTIALLRSRLAKAEREIEDLYAALTKINRLPASDDLEELQDIRFKAVNISFNALHLHDKAKEGREEAESHGS